MGGSTTEMVQRAVVALLLVVLWSAGLVGGTLFGVWRRPIAPPGDPNAFVRAAIPIIEAGNRGNTALVLIEGGAVSAEHYSTSADLIDRNTVFATASLSKWIAAHAVMKLVEQGKLDLDRPVESYLTRWRFPEGAFSSRDVTARRLLSHTAGLTDGLGFGDYGSDEPLPTLEEALAAPRASTGRPATIAVGIEPGSGFRYSGGGYLVLELLVEEVSGQPFDAFVDREVLEPLGMERSGYADLSVLGNSAKSYDAEGRPAPIHRYASKAATGFVTSAADMVRWVDMHLRTTEGGPLAQATLASMRRAEARSMGVDLWGLGTLLYAPTGDGDVVFGHDGTNEPAISATVRINPRTKDAIIVLATGSKGLASELGAEWVFWQTGLPDILTLPGEVEGVVPVLGAGVCGIVLLTFLVDRAHGLPDARVSDVRMVQEAGEPMKSIVLDGPSGAAFAALTAAHVGEALVVALDDRVLAAPLVREPIADGRVYLSGAEAERVLSALTAPRLPEGLVLRSIEVTPAR